MLDDNASCSLETNGQRETAFFIDPCNSHAARVRGAALLHYHGGRDICPDAGIPGG